jgi:hypothetical protein
VEAARSDASRQWADPGGDGIGGLGALLAMRPTNNVSLVGVGRPPPRLLERRRDRMPQPHQSVRKAHLLKRRLPIRFRADNLIVL